MAASSSMIYRRLGRTGMDLSIVSMGGSGYGKNYGPYDEKEAIRSFQHAISRGVNYIDTAYWYGQGHSERFLGTHLLPTIPRDKYYIATKVGRYELDLPNMFNFTAEKVTKSVEDSLKRLQLNEVDIVQVHDVEFSLSLNVILNETLPALERLQRRGLFKYIGITGYPLGPLKEVISKSPIRIDSVLSYARLSMNDWSLKEHFEFFKQHNVPIINACPVSMGLLTQGGLQDWHPAHPWIKAACHNAVQYCVEQGVDITKLALKYSTSFPEAVTTLVSMCDSGIVDSNIDAVLSSLSPHEEGVMGYIMENIFGDMTQRHWEGVELVNYWNAINNK